MDRLTYEQVLNELSPGKWFYEGKKCYVATRRKREPDKRVEFISDDIVSFIKTIKENKGEDIWLVGGSQLTYEFINQNVIDKYIITIIPTILGEGIPLFLKNNSEIKLKLFQTKNSNGIVELTYIKKKPQLNCEI